VALSWRATPAITSSGVTHVTSLSVPKQAGTAAGDWILMFAYGGVPSLACSGFSMVKDSGSFGGLLYRLADGTEGSSFNVTGFNNFSATVVIATISGAATSLDPATPATPNNGGQTTSLAINGITLSSAGDWLLWFCADESTGFTGNGQAITVPSGFSGQATNGSQSGSATISVASNESPGTGATGTKTGSCGTAAYFSGVMVGLTPLPAAAFPAASADGAGDVPGGAGIPVMTWSAGSADGTGTAAGPGTASGQNAAAAPDSADGTGNAYDAVPSTPAAAVVIPGSADGSGAGYAPVVPYPMTVLPGSGDAAGSAADAGWKMSSAWAADTAGAAGDVPGASPPIWFTATPDAASGTGNAVTAAIPSYTGISAGAGRPVPLPGGSQVAVAPPGSTMWAYLGTLGHVRDLTYSFTMPGGCDKMTCTLQVPAAFRSQALNPGWQVRVTRGGHVVWDGRLDEPQPGPGGWTVTAAGSAQRAQDFTAIYSGTWPSGQPDDLVNQAIARGLNWVNPGVGQPSWLWLGQPPDSGSQTVKQVLDAICSRGAGTWYVTGTQAGPVLSLLPIPAAVNRLLLVTTPVPRTLGAMVNRVVLRYQSAADNTDAGTSATYAVTTVTASSSVTAHQATEAYADLSDAGTMTAAAAQAAGNALLSQYQPAAWAGPFTAAPGQLLTTGGQPVDPGTDQAGTVIRCIITDYAFGGEVTPATPVQFCVGSYEWDDQHQVATITPYHSMSQDWSALASAQQTT